MMKRIILALCLLSVLGCNFHTADKNNPNDRQQAEEISNKFYSLFQMKKFDDVLAIMDDSFFTGIDKDKFVETLKANNEKLGNLISWKLIHWETVNVSSTQESGAKYLLVYKTDYDKHIAEETFSLKLENDTVKIVGYNVKSEGFLTK